MATFKIKQERILINKTFKSLREAYKWGEWNYKGKGNFEVVEVKNKGSKFTKKDFEEIKSLEKKGINAQGIAELTSWSIFTIRNYLKYNTLPKFLALI